MDSIPCADLGVLDGILARHPLEPASLIEVLQDVQHEYGYLPCDVLTHVASALSVPLSQVFSASTFYKAFSLVPQGKTVIKVCTGTACHIRGAQRLIDELTSQLKVQAGETTPDHRFTIKTVNCVGACAMAPVMLVGKKVHGDAKAAKIGTWLEGGES